MERIRCPEIKSIESINGKRIYVLGEGQIWYKTKKSYEIWQENPLFRIKSFSRKKIGWINKS